LFLCFFAIYKSLQGLLAISNGLKFIEYLGLPESVGNELGLPQFTLINSVFQMLPYTIKLPKMQALKSMKTLKELLIESSCPEEYQSILIKEIPHLKKCDSSSQSNFT
jgi:hypothetical protein